MEVPEQSKKMTYKEKIEKMRRKQLCYICLKPGRRSLECSAVVTCGICNGRYYDVMCKGPAKEHPDGGTNTTMMVGNPPQMVCGGYPGHGPMYHGGAVYYPQMGNGMNPNQPTPQQQQSAEPPTNSQGMATSQQPKQTNGVAGVVRNFQNLCTKHLVSLMTLLVRVDKERSKDSEVDHRWRI